MPTPATEQEKQRIHQKLRARIKLITEHEQFVQIRETIEELEKQLTSLNESYNTLRMKMFDEDPEIQKLRAELDEIQKLEAQKSN